VKTEASRYRGSVLLRRTLPR